MIPAKQSKAQRLVEIMREAQPPREDARQMLRPNAAMQRAWVNTKAS